MQIPRKFKESTRYTAGGIDLKKAKTFAYKY